MFGHPDGRQSDGEKRRKLSSSLKNLTFEKQDWNLVLCCSSVVFFGQIVMLVLTAIQLIVVVICSVLFDMSMLFEEGYPAVVPEEPEQYCLKWVWCWRTRFVRFWWDTSTITDNRWDEETIKIDLTEEGFKKTILDTCSSGGTWDSWSRHPSNTSWPRRTCPIWGSSRQSRRKHVPGATWWTTSTRQGIEGGGVASEHQRRLFWAVCLGHPWQWQHQDHEGSHCPTSLPPVGNTAGTEKKIGLDPLQECDVIIPCDQPSHKKAVLAWIWPEGNRCRKGCLQLVIVKMTKREVGNLL